MALLTGYDRDTEVEVQQRLLDALESSHGERLRVLLRATYAIMIDAYERTGAIPNLPDEFEQRLRQWYLDAGGASIEAFGGRVVTQGKAKGLILEVKSFAEFFQRLAEEWIAAEAIRQRISNVVNTTRAVIIDRISRGQAAGEGVDVIARGLRDAVPELSRTRSALIARTELHGAANYGANGAAISTGLRLRKEWVSVHDHRTRRISGRDPAEFDHWSMDGQTVDMDQPFLMPWTKSPLEPLRIMYPGEAGHPGGATIACRCSTVHTVID